MIDGPRRVLQARLQVVEFESGNFRNDFSGIQPGGEQIEHIRYADSHITDARTPAALLGLHRHPREDIFRRIHVRMLSLKVALLSARASVPGLPAREVSFSGELLLLTGQIGGPAGQPLVPQILKQFHLTLRLDQFLALCG